MTDDSTRLLQVFSGGVKIIGQSPQALTDNIITLKKIVIVNSIMTPQGIKPEMVYVEKNEDYLGEVTIHQGPGVTIFIVNTNGPLAKQYFDTISP